MNNFEKVFDLARDVTVFFEGLSLEAYHDPVGFPTIGYGHLLSREPFVPLNQWSPISKDEAIALLQQDMRKAYRSITILIKVELSYAQQAALMDFCFNCGAGNLQASTLLRKVNQGEFEAVPDQFRRWIYAGGQRLGGLIKRREAESNLWLSNL